MKIAFIYNEHKLSGKLTKFWTGSYCYHVAFVDEERGVMFDMNLIRRMRNWPYYGPETTVVLADAPVPVSYDFLFAKHKSSENKYGFADYVLFTLRPLFHLFGQSTPNARGEICSEMVANDLNENGWNHYYVEVPSPATLEREILNK